jgi:hypothetical protein
VRSATEPLGIPRRVGGDVMKAALRHATATLLPGEADGEH